MVRKSDDQYQFSMRSVSLAWVSSSLCSLQCCCRFSSIIIISFIISKESNLDQQSQLQRNEFDLLSNQSDDIIPTLITKLILQDLQYQLYLPLQMKGGFGKVYNQVGVDNFYQKTGQQYINPHRYDIERLIKKKFAPNNNCYLQINSTILDLACGSGEASLPLKQMGYKSIVGIDPYTNQKYQEVTALPCRTFTFLQILEGALDEQRFDAIFISYALHLVKESMLHDFCYKLASLSKRLIIISPHKFPVMRESFGWKELQNSVMDRVHLRVYQSFQFEDLAENEVTQKQA